MRKVAHFIVQFRFAIAIVFIVLAILCGFASLHVTVNSDMTQYLPENMQVKQGMDIMNEEFAETTPIRVMAKDVPTDKRQEIADDLAKFDLVESVSYESDSADYNNGDYVLYSLTLTGNSYSDDAKTGYDLVDKAMQGRGYEYWIAADIGNSASNLGPVYVAAVFLAVIILFVLSTSWIEPLLILITILLAVLINMGTNLIFPSISETTSSIAAVLQMALSMDYLIMLMNRYSDERTRHEPKLAMENALAKGVVAIASSSITTVVGLLCLVFMSFTIGADMGLVLAKGVLISLICVFAIMPMFAIEFDYWILALKKPHPRPKMKGLTTFSYKLRVPLLIVFVALFVGGFAMRNVTTVDFEANNNTDDTAFVEEIFPADSQVVILYDNAQQANEDSLVAAVEAMDGVKSVQSYGNTVGKRYTAAEMADQMDMDESVVRVLFYYKFNDGAVQPLTRDQFASYLRDGVKTDLGGMLDDDKLSSMESLASLVDALDDGSYTYERMASALDLRAVPQGTIKLLYTAYFANRNFDDSWTMSLDEVTAFLVDDLMNDSAFDSFFDTSTRKTLTDAREQVESGADQLRGSQHSRVVLSVPYDASSTEMDTFVGNLSNTVSDQIGSDGWYLVGEGPMTYDMTRSFPSEFNFISILTIIAIFIIVLITFRSIAVPFVLVALVQSAFCWDMALNFMLGNSIYYLALIVVQSILMGATIDYAILFTTNYRRARGEAPVHEALGQAYRESFRTVAMSGGILVVVTGVIGLVLHDLTGKICLIIGEGALIAVIMVLVILPGAIAALDKLIVPKKMRYENQAAGGLSDDQPASEQSDAAGDAPSDQGNALTPTSAPASLETVPES